MISCRELIFFELLNTQELMLILTVHSPFLNLIHFGSIDDTAETEKASTCIYSRRESLNSKKKRLTTRRKAYGKEKKWSSQSQ